ncbi:hemin uptake protein HemP [Nitrosomonas marina]|uniref:Hemin uptake protein hemP n=1 Tax=Nitrosomonas marina TaxID=917 RepID=A0A1H8CLD1_9PROT|nr:hemin uptake protein HemP [Nitrosomonas marina]SEM95845.1 Hemin uptake protein hemP [Nitrosomonas marina]
MYDSTKIQSQAMQHGNMQVTETPSYNLAIDSSTLFAHSNVVYIQHHGECYLLRKTRSGKLILTK